MGHGIAFFGRKQTGKDTAARIAASYIGPSSRTFHFADNLKKAAVQMLGLPPELVYGSNEDKNQYTNFTWGRLPDLVRTRYRKQAWEPMTIRHVLQVLGSDIFRDLFHSDVHVTACVRDIESSSCHAALIADGRFPNELEAASQAGLVTVLVIRNTGDKADLHQSENALDRFPESFYDYILDNSGSEDDLQASIWDLLVRSDIPSSPPPIQYLAGGIDKAADQGRGWRQQAQPILEKKGYRVFNPVKEDDGLEVKPETIFKIHNRAPGYQALMKDIRRRDLEALQETKDSGGSIVCYWDASCQAGGGTHHELAWAYHNQVPVYAAVVPDFSVLSVWTEQNMTTITSNLDSLLDKIPRYLPGGPPEKGQSRLREPRSGF